MEFLFLFRFAMSSGPMCGVMLIFLWDMVYICAGGDCTRIAYFLTNGHKSPHPHKVP